MNISRFVATIAIAAATVVAPAEARPTMGQQQLVSALERAGVTTSVGDCVPHGVTGVHGFFVPAKNHIHICDDVATTDKQQWETFRHEAVHAAQRCVNPSMAFTVNSSQYLLANGSQSDWEFIQQAYPREDWAIELEAFTLMRASNSEIARLVDDACNN